MNVLSWFGRIQNVQIDHQDLKATILVDFPLLTLSRLDEKFGQIQTFLAKLVNRINVTFRFNYQENTVTFHLCYFPCLFFPGKEFIYQLNLSPGNKTCVLHLYIRKEKNAKFLEERKLQPQNLVLTTKLKFFPLLYYH